MTGTPIRLFHRAFPVHVLGPGRRAVVWVQGCPFRCPGCTSPESLDPAGGEDAVVEDVATWVLSCPDVEGVTFSGGEPMAQAGALARLVDLIRAEHDLGVVCYTGYTLDYLRQHGTPEQHALLDRVDLLIDGPYIAERHAILRWRGSSNQRLIALTDRYRREVEGAADTEAGMEVFVTDGGAVCIAGVPPVAGFRESMQAALDEELRPAFPDTDDSLIEWH